MFEIEKKQMKNFISNLKKQMKARDKIIQEQKVLIQKNNIINRITYSQLIETNDLSDGEKN